MAPDLEYLAEKKGMSVEEVLNKLKESYDGYHFTWPSPDIYNPYSLLLAFDKERFASFWFESGTPTYLVEMLRKYHVIPQKIGNHEALAEEFDTPTERITNIIPLLYQSGYLTIKREQGSPYRPVAGALAQLRGRNVHFRNDHGSQNVPMPREGKHGRSARAPEDLPLDHSLL